MFSGVVGHTDILQKLQQALSLNKVGNAYLFAGPDGIGKALIAKKMAVQLIDGTSEKRVLENNHPDFHEYFPQGKTYMHSIQSIRDLIDLVYMAPYEGKAKVFLIHDADRMLASSANALLKTLEEPTSDSYIILLSSKSTDLLPTILSRLSVLNFSPLKDHEIETILSSHLEISKEQKDRIISTCNGTVSKALSLANLEDTDMHQELFALLSTSSLLERMDLLDQFDSFFASEDRLDGEVSKEIQEIAASITLWYKNRYLYAKGLKEQIEPLDMLPYIEKAKHHFLPHINKIHQQMEEFLDAVQRNVKVKTALEHLLYQLSDY